VGIFIFIITRFTLGFESLGRGGKVKECRKQNASLRPESGNKSFQ
jgi:hypothetical protein